MTATGHVVQTQPVREGIYTISTLVPGLSYLGVFLVGAYQETLGDLHNLLGDTNVVSIRISEDGSYQFVREIRGDSVADILDYVEYDPRRILEDLREAAERAVREKRITPSERYKILQTFEDGLRGYTYFER